MNARRDNRGFTLIELLVVVAIIGILSAIGISQYAFYKQRAIDATVESALNSARLAIESFYVKNQTYVGADLTILETDFGMRPVAGSDVVLNLPAPTASNYLIRGCAQGATSPSFVYSSVVGVVVPDSGTCS